MKICGLCPGVAAEREPYRSVLLAKQAGVLVNLELAQSKQSSVFEAPKDGRDAWRYFLAWAELKLPKL